MTDEHIRALCLEAATKSRPNYSGLGGGGPSILADARRIYDWVKTGGQSFVVAVAPGQSDGLCGGGGRGSQAA